MKKTFRFLKLYLLPILLFVIPGIAGLFLEGYNRYYRGTPSPFFYPSLGLLILGLFFWIKSRWGYLILLLLTITLISFGFHYYLSEKSEAPSVVYYYQDWVLDTKDGHIELSRPLGKHPPEKGPYISCSFSFYDWKSYLNFQPSLCTAFDHKLRLKMFLHDQTTEAGLLREFHLNQYFVDRKSLLGETLDRSALRIAFALKERNITPLYEVKAIYQVYEKEIGPGKTKVVESFSWDPKGRLKQFTESPMMTSSNRDIYAVYNSQGLLVEIPRMKGKSFSFPARIDVKDFKVYSIPDKIQSAGDAS